MAGRACESTARIAAAASTLSRATTARSVSRHTRRRRYRPRRAVHIDLPDAEIAGDIDRLCRYSPNDISRPISVFVLKIEFSDIFDYFVSFPRAFIGLFTVHIQLSRIRVVIDMFYGVQSNPYSPPDDNISVLLVRLSNNAPLKSIRLICIISRY